MKQLLGEVDGHAITVAMSELCGVVCSYPLLVVATSINVFTPVKLLSPTTWKLLLAVPFHICQRNGLTALWWGITPYLIGRLVTTLVADQVDIGLELASEKWFPTRVDANDTLESVAKGLAVKGLKFVTKAAICAMVACPLQVVTYYLQANSYLEGGRQLLSSSGFWCIKHLWRQGGLLRFFWGVQYDFRASICSLQV